MSSIHRPGPAPVQCPHCGKMLNEDDLYCRYCGRPMVATGFDDDGQGGTVRPTAGQGPALRGIGDRPTLNDPLASNRPRGGALDRFNPGSLGCATIIGILAGVLILIMLVAWFAIRPSIAGSAEDGVRNGLARELATDSVAAGTSTVALDETTLNEYLDAGSAWFDPLDDIKMTIADNQAKASFKLYGLSGTFTAGMTVQDGVIRLINPSVSGAGGRLVKADDIADAIEDEIRAFVQSESRPISNVTLADGVLTITFVTS
ncbi:MAG: zinc ribbon domain-containing protein [Thermomicrobiales bacterium]